MRRIVPGRAARAEGSPLVVAFVLALPACVRSTVAPAAPSSASPAPSPPAVSAGLERELEREALDPARSVIRSADGNVYIHWEFHRDEVYACSTMNCRPFILAVSPP